MANDQSPRRNGKAGRRRRSAKKSSATSTEPRHAPAWLRMAALSLLLIVAPTAIYFFIYRESRIEDAIVRNFRALDAAAERVVQVTENLSSVVDGSSFGVSVTMLDELTTRLTGKETRHLTLQAMGCGDGSDDTSVDDGGVLTHEWEPVLFEPPLEQKASLELRYQLAARFLRDKYKKHPDETRELWKHLYCLIKKHRRYSAPVETVTVSVNPLAGSPLRPSAWLSSGCAGTSGLGQLSGYECHRRLREWLGPDQSERCSNPRRSTEFDRGRRVVVTDCRPLRERNRDLHDALRGLDATDDPERRSVAADVIRVIDLFGVQSVAELDRLLANATRFLSRSFDSYLIADGAGRILFEADAFSDSAIEAGGTRAATEADERRAATPAFSNHVSISELIERTDSSSSGRAGNAEADETSSSLLRSIGSSASRLSRSAERSRYGRSFVEKVQIEDVGLRVFVQPFLLDGVDVSGTLSNGTDRPVYYVVGIVDNREFESAAIRLRLSLVLHATLALLVILTLCPLLWFWTSGDRWVLGPWALAGVCTTSVVGVVLFVVLACSVMTNRIDERVLDTMMERVADRIKRLFDLELHEDILALHGRVSSSAEGVDPRDANEAGLERLNPLEKKFYCDETDRDLEYDHRKRYRERGFLMNMDGRQSNCWSDGRLTRTRRLDLQFREYFTRPKEGALWPPDYTVQGVSCWTRFVMDEESFVPCIVPQRLEAGRYVGTETTFTPTTLRDETPYFLDRIDSIVMGNVLTMLAINTCDTEPPADKCADEPVATSVISLNSIDRAVPPSHVNFAVVDRRTGQNLFHSDGNLAMATNFADDVGGDPALWALLRSGVPDTIDLVHTGTPVRAHVAPLRDGMPWALIVYRGHEIEDRLSALATALAVFFTLLLTLFFFTIVVGLLLLAASLCKFASLPSFPVGLGRVMVAGTDFQSTVKSRLALGVVIGLTPLAFLLWWMPWRGFPYFAVGPVVIVFSYLVWCVCQTASGPAAVNGAAANGEKTNGEKTSSRKSNDPNANEKPANEKPANGKMANGGTVSGDEFNEGGMRRVLTLSLVIVLLAVVPAGMWFSHHRAELGAGLNDYLRDRTVEAMNSAREEYRLYRLRERGAGIARLDDRTVGRQPYTAGEASRTGESGLYAELLDMLRAVVAWSTLSNDLMIYRGLSTADAGGASPVDVYDETFGYGISKAWPASVVMQLAVWLLLAVALIGFIAWSIHEMVIRRPREGDEKGTALACTRERFEGYWQSLAHDQQPGLFYPQPESFDQQLELFALARGGVVNSRRPSARTTLSVLMKEGIVRVDHETGVAQLRCPEFGDFIRRDVDRRKFVAWQKEERGGLWRFIWPPVLIFVGLGLAFLFFANPEIQSTLLAGLASLLPAVLGLSRGSGASVPGPTDG